MPEKSAEILHVRLGDLIPTQGLPPGNRLQRRFLAMEYDPDAAGLISLCRRATGELAIIDGHMRVQLAQKSGLDSIPALVLDGLSLEDETRIVNMFTCGVKRVAADADRLKAHPGELT